jgi:hypothetical protein
MLSARASSAYLFSARISQWRALIHFDDASHKAKGACGTILHGVVAVTERTKVCGHTFAFIAFPLFRDS